MEVSFGRLSLPVHGSFHVQSQPNIQNNVLMARKKLENINCIQEETSFHGGIFLGDIITLLKPQILIKHNIQAIISCISESNYEIQSRDICRKIIKAKDNLDYPINEHFDEAYQFIQQMRQNKKNVLVHCHAGVSRSATIVCAYLMRKKKWKMNEALQYMKKKRERIRPNENFINILVTYQQKLLTEKSKKQTKQNRPIFNRIRSVIKGEEDSQPIRKVLKQHQQNEVPKRTSIHQQRETQNIVNSSCSSKVSRIITSPVVNPMKVSFQSHNTKINIDYRCSFDNTCTRSINNENQHRVLRNKRADRVYQINWNSPKPTY